MSYNNGPKPKLSRDEKKAKRRSAQNAKLEQKSKQEAAHFWQCAGRGGDAVPRLGAAELFASQSTGINFSQYEAIPVTRGRVSKADVAPPSFASVKNVPGWLKQTLTAPDRMNYDTPTPIQKHTIPSRSRARRHRDRADGSGRATRFCRRCEIADEAVKLTFDAPKSSKNWCVCCYGGANARGQLARLARGVEILVATPGRLVDFLERSSDRGPLVSLESVRFAVLDEADRMLDMGFEPQLRKIVAKLPAARERQTLMFSATFSPAVQQVARAYLDGSRVAEVTVGRVGSSVASIEQRLVFSPASDKRSKLELLLPVLAPGEKTIVFVQKKHVATWVKRELAKAKFRAEDIHGDRSQSQREAALESFKQGRCDVLVATDVVAARGLDVNDVAHVVQFDLPQDDFDTYVHRIGRTGRAGKTGVATAFFVPGFEPKHGNQALHRDLLRMLEENKQQVPRWFRDVGVGKNARGAATQAPRKAPPAPAPPAPAKKSAARRASAAAGQGAQAAPRRPPRRPPRRRAAAAAAPRAQGAAEAQGAAAAPPTEFVKKPGQGRQGLLQGGAPPPPKSEPKGKGKGGRGSGGDAPPAQSGASRRGDGGSARAAPQGRAPLGLADHLSLVRDFRVLI
ncbi:helicase [Aureococcus anophagefferens]|nr:helicase [Aureococcus anophagefferens]